GKSVRGAAQIQTFTGARDAQAPSPKGANLIPRRVATNVPRSCLRAAPGDCHLQLPFLPTFRFGGKSPRGSDNFP
ncbi:MAG: hypothetical protein ACI4X9_05975, partial [Kiritimatiellia bacterium]